MPALNTEDKKIRVLIESTKDEFKTIIDVLDQFLKDKGNIPSIHDLRVVNFRDMLTRQVMSN